MIPATIIFFSLATPTGAGLECRLGPGVVAVGVTRNDIIDSTF